MAKSSLGTGSCPAWAPACHELGQNQHHSPRQTLGQKNLSAENCWGYFMCWFFFFSHHNFSCFFQTISRDAHTTSGCALHFPLLPLQCCPPTRMPGQLSAQLGSISPRTFLLLEQLRGALRPSVFIRSLSWGAAPSPAPIIGHPGAPRLPPLPCQGCFLCTTDGQKLFGSHLPSLRASSAPWKDASPEQGAVPSQLQHSSLFTGAGKSLTRLSFSAGGRAAFHSHDKLLLSKLHECSY